MSSVDDDDDNNDYDDDEISPPENIKGRKKNEKILTYLCDNQFLTNTLVVIMNIYIYRNNRHTLFFVSAQRNIVKTIILSFVYIRERERDIEE